MNFTTEKSQAQYQGFIWQEHKDLCPYLHVELDGTTLEDLQELDRGVRAKFTKDYGALLSTDSPQLIVMDSALLATWEFQPQWDLQKLEPLFDDDIIMPIELHDDPEEPNHPYQTTQARQNGGSGH